MGDFNSIRYEPGKQHEFVKMKLGGTEVLVWRPDGIGGSFLVAFLFVVWFVLM